MSLAPARGRAAHDSGGLTILLTPAAAPGVRAYAHSPTRRSGLRTQFGLINDGYSVGMTLLVIVVATASKIIGISLPCCALGIPFRTSATLGVLMSCKG